MGGGQENGFRSGTEGTPAIFGFAAACAAGAATFKADIDREKALLNYAIEKISGMEGIRVNGAHEAPHILSLSVPGVPTQNTLNLLQEDGICISAGSACAKGHRSHVLSAMNLPPEVIDGAFRVSLSRETTTEEINILLKALEERVLPFRLKGKKF